MRRTVELGKGALCKMSSDFWARKPALPWRIGRDEKGQALTLVLAAMAIGTLLIAPFLTQANTTLLSSRDYAQAIIRQYSADAGVEHAIWRLNYEPGFADSLTPANPTTNYPITVNNTIVNINVTWVEIIPPPNPPPPPEGPEADRIQMSKSVAPNSAPVSQQATFTYVISIDNVATSVVKIAEVRDLLPTGFSYVAGSSSGITTADPTIELEGGQQKLRWIFPVPKPDVAAGQVVTLTFQAIATLQMDIYWNETWAALDPEGIGTRGTGSTAPVGGGGMSPYGYDILSNAGGTAIRARVTMNDIGVPILSWKVE